MRPPAKRKERLIRQLLAVAAFAAGLVLLYRFLVGGNGSDIEATQAPERHGYYLNDATLTELGVDGRPRTVVRARNIEQQLADQSVLLTGLELDYHSPEAGDWTVTAERGRMPVSRESVQLAGNVTVSGGEKGGPMAVIRTEQLAYQTTSSIIQTSDPVTIVFGQHELNGRGLTVNLNAGTLRLESNVNGRFKP
jgi:LPS export ABC transporter protein LptC